MTLFKLTNEYVSEDIIKKFMDKSMLTCVSDSR